MNFLVSFLSNLLVGLLDYYMKRKDLKDSVRKGIALNAAKAANKALSFLNHAKSAGVVVRLDAAGAGAGLRLYCECDCPPCQNCAVRPPR